MGRLDPSKDLDHHELLTSRAAGHTIAKSGIYLIQDGPLFTPLDVALRLRVAKADSHVVATVEAAGGSVAEVRAVVTRRSPHAHSVLQRAATDGPSMASSMQAPAFVGRRCPSPSPDS